MTTRPTHHTPDTDTPGHRAPRAAHAHNPVAHTNTGTWRAHTTPWRDDPATMPNPPAAKPQHQALEEDFDTTVQQAPATGRWNVGTTTFGIPKQPPTAGAHAPAHAAAHASAPVAAGAATATATATKVSATAPSAHASKTTTTTVTPPVTASSPAHTAAHSAAHAGTQTHAHASSTADADAPVPAGELIARLKGNSTAAPRRRGRYLIEDTTQDAPRHSPTATAQAAAAPAAAEPVAANQAAPSPVPVTANKESASPATPTQHSTPTVHVTTDGNDLATSVAKKVAATRGFSAQPSGSWAAITDLRQVRAEATTAARAQHPANPNPGKPNPGNPSAVHPSPATPAAHAARQAPAPEAAAASPVVPAPAAAQVETAPAAPGKPAAHSPTPVPVVAPRTPADDVVDSNHPDPAPAPMAPLVPRTPPRHRGQPEDSPLKARAVAHRRPTAGPYESFAALWAVPDGSAPSLARPSQQRALRRWLVALVVAALIATAGVVLATYGLLESVEWATTASRWLIGASAVLALLAEAALRPRQGVC